MNEKLATVKAHVIRRWCTPRTDERRNGHGPAPRRGDPARARRGVGRDGRRLGRDAGDRPRPGLPHGPPGAAHRARGPRGARPVATAPPASPSPRPSPGASSSGSRSRDASVVVDRPAPRTSRSGTTGSGSAGSSPSARSARATRSSPSSRPRSTRRPRRSRRNPTTPSSRRCATGSSAFLVFVRLFDRAVGLVPQLEPRELERSLQPARPHPGRDDPAAVRPARRPAGR